MSLKSERINTQHIHNIIEIHNNFFCGLTILCKIFLTLDLNDGIFHILLSVMQNTVIDLNDVMIWEKAFYITISIGVIKPNPIGC